MKCLVEGCGWEAKALGSHIKCVHKMGVKEYEKIYEVDSVTDDDLKSKRKESRRLNKLNKDIKCPVDGCGFACDTHEQLIDHCYRQTNSVPHSHVMFDGHNVDDWVECKCGGCGYRRGKIVDHVQKVHSISRENYEIHHGLMISKNYSIKAKNNGAKAGLTAANRKYQHKCKKCGTIINGKALICETCKSKKHKEKQELKFQNLIEGQDFVRCKCTLGDGTICNWPDKRIANHLLKSHQYNTQDYRKNYPGCPTTCNSTNIKTTQRNTHKKFHIHTERSSWNDGLNKHDHPGLQKISDKAKKRFANIENNPWHYIKPHHEKTDYWVKGLNNDNSEYVKIFAIQNSGLYHHRSNFQDFDVNNLGWSDVNKYVEEYESGQKARIKMAQLKCFESKDTCSNNLIVHHIIPRNCFEYNNLLAHNYRNLIVLCDKCHSGIAQRVDHAFLNSGDNLKKMKKNYKEEYSKMLQWMNFAGKTVVSSLPIKRAFIQKLSEENKEFLIKDILNEYKDNFPKLNYNEDYLVKDFNNIKDDVKTIDKLANNKITSYKTSGLAISEHFIKTQYSIIKEVYNEQLEASVRDLFGQNSENHSFEISDKTIISNFKKQYPIIACKQYKASIFKYILQKYCNSDNVHDFSIGWGVRALAAASVGKNYYGIMDYDNVEEINNLFDWIKKLGTNAEIKHDFSEKVDFVYLYEPTNIDDAQQKTNFYLERIKKSLEILNIGGRIVCQVQEGIAEQVENLLENSFKKIDEIKYVNTYSAFHENFEKIPERILVYENI